MIYIAHLWLSLWLIYPSGHRPLHCWGFVITLRHTTLGRTPLQEGRVRRRDLCLKIHNTHRRQISMPPEGFEPAVPGSDRPHSHALNRAATEFGHLRTVKCTPQTAQGRCLWGNGQETETNLVGYHHSVKWKISLRLERQHYKGALKSSRPKNKKKK